MSYGLGPVESEDRRGRTIIRTGGRLRRPVFAFVALLVMMASAGGLWTVYRWATRASGEVPLIRADNQPTRMRPKEPGGMSIPNQDVLMPGRPEPKIEQLLPAPEAPLPRPIPAETTGDTPTATATPAAPSPTPPANIAMAPTAPSPPPAPAAPTAVAPAPAVHPPRPAAAPTVAPQSPPAATTTAAGYKLQLGAVRTPESAQQEWDRLKRLHADILGKLAATSARVDLGERGVFYRIQAGPLSDATVAERDCNELKRRGIGCILVKP